MVKLSEGRTKRVGLEQASWIALVSFSEFASSVGLIEEEGKIKIQIRGSQLTSELPYFNECIGSPGELRGNMRRCSGLVDCL